METSKRRLTSSAALPQRRKVDRVSAANLLADVFRAPRSVAELRESEWDLLVRQARRAQLLARLCARLDELGLSASAPAAAQRHLRSARIFASKYERDVLGEILHVRDALRPAGLPLILLKGSAYAASGLPAAEGRLFSDIDILVPRERLGEAERALREAGWRSTKLGEYDQSYYRRWMHELPPMRHRRRRSMLDVHHTILPLTATPKIDAKKIIASAKPTGTEGVLVLSPEDMVLHAAAHQFHDGEFRAGLRELVDMDSLLRHFSASPGFWGRLTARATELDLGRALHYALRYASRVLGSPAPPHAFDAIAGAAPNGPMRILMDWLILRALAPEHPSCDALSVRASRTALYVRSHFLRMPLRLLLPHLARKAVLRLAVPSTKTDCRMCLEVRRRLRAYLGQRP
jgi:hypothetical protein